MKIGQGISTYKNIAVVARTSCITIADSKKIYNIRTIISYLYFVWIYFVILQYSASNEYISFIYSYKLCWDGSKEILNWALHVDYVIIQR